MRGDQYRKRVDGQSGIPPTAVFNKLTEMSQGWDFDSGSPPPQVSRQASIVSVRNDSGDTVPRFGVLAVGGPLIDPTQDPLEFAGQVALAGTTPTVSLRGKFVITLEPIEIGCVGRAVAGGVAIARLAVNPSSPHLGYADIEDGSTGAIRNYRSGGAAVLWVHDDGQAEQWAIVRLGQSRTELETDLYAATLPAYTRSGNTITYDADGAAAAIEGTTPALGTVVLYNPGIQSGFAVDAGLWVFTDIGSASTPAVLRRVCDCQPGMLVHVVDGSPLVGMDVTTSISGGEVTGVSIGGGSLKFVDVPAIRFVGGGGSGATATATLNGSGILTSITVDEGGSGYTTEPTVSINGVLQPTATYNFRGTQWVLATDGPITLNETELVFRRFPGRVVKYIELTDDTWNLDVGEADVVVLTAADTYKIYGIAAGLRWNGRRVELQNLGPAALRIVGNQATSQVHEGIHVGAGTGGGPHDRQIILGLYEHVVLTCQGGVDADDGRGMGGGGPATMSSWVANLTTDRFLTRADSFDDALIGAILYGSGATAHAVLTGDVVTSIVIDTPGSGYDGDGEFLGIVFTGGGGSGAIADAQVDGGEIVATTVHDGGSGYVSPPTISFVRSWDLWEAAPSGPTVYHLDKDGEYHPSAYCVRRSYLGDPSTVDDDDPTLGIDFPGCDYDGLGAGFGVSNTGVIEEVNGVLILGGLVIRFDGSVFAKTATLNQYIEQTDAHLDLIDDEIDALEGSFESLVGIVESLGELINEIAEDALMEEDLEDALVALGGAGSPITIP